MKFGGKVYALVTALVVAVMAAASTLFLVSQNRALEQALVKEGRSLTQGLIEGTGLGMILEDPSFIAQEAAGLLALPDVLLADFYRADGSLLLHLGRLGEIAAPPAAAFTAARQSGLSVARLSMALLPNGASLSHPPMVFLAPVKSKDGEVAGFVRVAMSTAAIALERRQNIQRTALATLLLIAFSCLAAYFLVRRVTQPLAALTEGAQRISKGDLQCHIPEGGAKDEIGNLARQFNAMAAELAVQREHALQEQKLAYRLFTNVVRRGCLDSLNGSHLISPHSLFNGDLLLALPTPAGALRVMLGDFTGHGLAAAIGAMPVSEVFYAMTHKGFPLAKTIREINGKLKHILPADIFLAACIIEVDLDDRSLLVWNGGIPDVMLKRGDGITALASTQLPLGILPTSQLDADPERLDIEEGDRVYLYSDGLIEARNHAGDMLGRERLIECIRACGSEPAFAAIGAMLRDFRGSAGQDDDISLLELTCSHPLFASKAKKTSAQALPAQVAKSNTTSSWELSLNLEPSALRDLDPLPQLVQMLTEIQELQSHRERIYMILAELYSNALEHSVLGLDSSEKASAEGFARYYSERQLRLDALDDGSIRLHIRHEPNGSSGRLIMHMLDTGPGFDFERFLTAKAPTSAFHGRGIPLLQSLCKKLRYQGSGNQVEAIYEWNKS